MRRFLFQLVWGFWFGAGLFLTVVAAPTAFRTAGSPQQAAAVVGGMLGSWHWIAIASPLLIGVLATRAVYSRRLFATLAVAVILAAVQIIVDREIASIRAESTTPISELERTDPVRKRFGYLHGASSALLLAQLIAAATVSVGAPSRPV